MIVDLTSHPGIVTPGNCGNISYLDLETNGRHLGGGLRGTFDLAHAMIMIEED